MGDELSGYYEDLLDGSYDCVDRIVLNAYYRLGYSAGGFRQWWRRLMHGSEAHLDNAHLMRLAGRFSRRVRAFAKAHQIPVIECLRGERKHEIAAAYLAAHAVGRGLFLILVARSGAGVGGPALQHGHDPAPDQEATVCEPLLLPHRGPGLGAPHDQDGRAPSLRRAGHPERA
jgi:hypothetical protein